MLNTKLFLIHVKLFWITPDNTKKLFPGGSDRAAMGQVMREVGDVHTWSQVLGLS